MLRRLLRRGPTPEPQIEDLRFRTIDAADTASYPDLIVDLTQKRIDGMMIRGVFTPDEVDRALAVLKARRGEGLELVWGTMLGMPLYYIGDRSEDRTPFLDETDHWRPVYEEAFGFDPFERVASVLRPMTGHYGIEPPSEGGRVYNPGNVRFYDPGKGGLRAHAGNEFKEQVGTGAMTHLLTLNEINDHMSWFVVLQPSEVGGELSIFHLLYADHQEPKETWRDADRDDRWIDDVPALRVSPGPGDMIIFGGGWRWHRVEPVEGSIPRITYGGFARPSRDDQVIHLWC